MTTDRKYIVIRLSDGLTIGHFTSPAQAEKYRRMLDAERTTEIRETSTESVIR